MPCRACVMCTHAQRTAEQACGRQQGQVCDSVSVQQSDRQHDQKRERSLLVILNPTQLLLLRTQTSPAVTCAHPNNTQSTDSLTVLVVAVVGGAAGVAAAMLPPHLRLLLPPLPPRTHPAAHSPAAAPAAAAASGPHPPTCTPKCVGWWWLVCLLVEEGERVQGRAARARIRKTRRA